MKRSIQWFIIFGAGGAFTQEAARAQDRLPSLIAGLDSPKKNVRLNSANAIGNHGTGARSAAAALKALVDGEADPQVAFEAVRALTRIGAHAELRELLRHADQQIRWQSLSGLAMIGPPAKKAVSELLDLLSDPQPLTRMLAAQALGEIGLESEDEMRRLVRMLRDADEDVRQFVVCALMNLGPNSVPALEHLLEDTEPIWVRTASLQALANQGPLAKAVVPKLIKLLRDPEAELRTQSALALAAVGANAKEVLPTLLENLLDKNMQVQTSAFQAAITIGQEDRRGLSSGLKIANAKGRWAAPFVGKKDVPGLIQKLSDKDIGTRVAAALTLGQIGKDADPAIPQLTRLLKDDDKQVQNAARQALAQLDRKNAEAYSKKLRRDQEEWLRDAKSQARFAAKAGKFVQRTQLEQLKIVNPQAAFQIALADGGSQKLGVVIRNVPQQAYMRQVVMMHIAYSLMKDPPSDAVDWISDRINDTGVEAVPALVEGLNLAMRYRLGFV
jgi:HEAT repeat protein